MTLRIMVDRCCAASFMMTVASQSFMLSVIMLNVVMLNVVMLSVVSPYCMLCLHRTAAVAQWQNTCLVILRSSVRVQLLPLALKEKKWEKVCLLMRTCNDLDAPSSPNIKFHCQPICLASKIDMLSSLSSTINNLKLLIVIF